MPYHLCDRHSVTEMSWGASPDVLTIVSVCVSDSGTQRGRYTGQTIRTTCTHTHTHTHTCRHTHTHIKQGRQCTLSPPLRYFLFPLSLTQRLNHPHTLSLFDAEENHKTTAPSHSLSFSVCVCVYGCKTV